MALSFPLHMQDQTHPAVLLLFRSQTLQEEALYEAVPSNPILLGDTRVHPIHTAQLTLSQSSKRWTLLGPGTLCCMTGLASDVDYLTRRLQQLVEHDAMVQDGAYVPTVHARVSSLATMMRAVTHWSTDRPYGVQALMLGRQPMASTNSTTSTTDRLETLSLVTLDPSGGYRHWGVATAIGRAASLVRKRLYESLLRTSVTSVETALTVCLNATVLALEGGANPAVEPPVYSGLLVWYRNGRLRLATIDQAEIVRIRDSMLRNQDSILL